MTNRYEPSEEYRRRLRDRHVLEGFCLINAGAMLILSVIFLLDIDRSLWVPEAVVVLGGVMNMGLSVRGVLAKSWIQTVSLFLVGCVCFGLLAWMNWT